ncbi:pyridoxal phosphate-dependent aminotransferase [Actinomadura latina]|uniref:Pyridoxal phosphate-dependent aminotransferase n=1 Tax=Actinomadura latina TaxID=163603 RepID=A0A846YSW7_9ACTN|nr:pyridoxal phosphate-dependent aminotransferase [Actinomadura latina]NKZ03429.1 pyridoxal phosphate-dependent aminotransferase [Actinomadura latina]
MSRIPGPLIERRIRPNRLPDTEWLNAYTAAGSPAGEPLMLSLGETWSGTPPELLAALRRAPDTLHGYQLSMYGYPRLRRVLREYVDATQGPLPPAGWEVAVGWTGTRSAMFDFCDRVRAGWAGRGPDALVVAPSWDYAGMLEPLGFRMRYVTAGPATGLVPDPDLVRAAAAAPGLGLVVINAQHNPTGANWDSELIGALVDAALDQGAAVLVDDAYFGLCPEPTSALAILLERLGNRMDQIPWLGVRSLGKQFRCNGWGLGAVVAEPGFLELFVNEIRTRHTYNYSANLQHAMADWLEDGNAVRAYLRSEQERIGSHRRAVARRLSGSLPAGRLIAGPAAPYLLFPVPRTGAAASTRGFLCRCATEAGVLLADAWPMARPGITGDNGYVRMYLGAPLAALNEACDRLENAELLSVA